MFSTAWAGRIGKQERRDDPPLLVPRSGLDRPGAGRRQFTLSVSKCSAPPLDDSIISAFLRPWLFSEAT